MHHPTIIIDQKQTAIDNQGMKSMDKTLLDCTGNILKNIEKGGTMPASMGADRTVSLLNWGPEYH